MKKNKYLIFISFLLLLTVILLIIKNSIKEENKEEKINELVLEEILFEINLASNEQFNEISINDITLYFPLNLSNYNNILFAVDKNNSDEYFLIGKNLNYDEISQLNEIYSMDKENILFYSNEKYVYIIKSEVYSYMIDGIIKSFIINHESKE